ncbi:MAG: 3-hydroxyacyl-CoA dehydrogenase family protein [Syntrophaceae bacterium]|nr:3-hydroxyacyl-CoA dehydrogenase family protein [Syntrophaceae bacterium]
MSNKVAVIGAGTMGSGIAQVAAEGGFDVVIIDTAQDFLDRGLGGIKNFIGRKVTKGSLTQAQGDEILSRLSTATNMEEAVKGAALVVEAVFEKVELKQEIFRKLDALCPADVILASNTSTIPISTLASVTRVPERVIGTHYFSPVPLMRLVEVIRGEKTGDATAEQTVDFCRKFGKTPIVVKDIPGFIVNRFLCLIYNESCNMILNGSARAEDIDQAMKLGCNWPMGPNEIIDLAGVDVCGFAMDAMYAMTGEERYKPSPLFKQMMDEKKLGRKTGQGFYNYKK